MAVTINRITQIIDVPKADLTLVSGTLYELDTDDFRLILKDIEDSAEGAPFPDTHQHNTEVTVAGVTYARTIEIINGYSIEFEDGQYSVRLVGSNNNFFDVENGILVQNQVQVIPTNSGGLIAADTLDLDDAIETGYSMRQVLRIMAAALTGKLSGAPGPGTITIRDVNDTKDRISATVDANGNRTAITIDVSE